MELQAVVHDPVGHLGLAHGESLADRAQVREVSAESLTFTAVGGGQVQGRLGGPAAIPMSTILSSWKFHIVSPARTGGSQRSSCSGVPELRRWGSAMSVWTSTVASKPP